MLFQALYISILFSTLSVTYVHTLKHRLVPETKVDECANPIGNACSFVTCENGGRCTEDPTTPDCFKCHCSSGFTGRICDTPIVITPGCNPGCENGGACNVNVCVCPLGFTGTFCERIDYCSPTNPCQNGGRCSSTINSYLCDCDGTGFTGAICTELITTNPCTSSPCQNGAQCSWNGLTMSCSCIGGYTGTFCQVSPVPCAATPCENGGKCELIDGNTYGCVCPEQFAGTRCETYMLTNHPCVTMAAEVCRNGGVCTVDGNDYLCNCAPGWSGRNCEVRETPSSCNPSPCGNHGSCVEAIAPSGSIAYCNCEDQWTGRYCDVQISAQCYDGYCLAGGICRINGNLRYCECPPLYTGARCESFAGALTTTTTVVPGVRPCSSSPCQNGGTCYSDMINFICTCLPNWTGPTCSIPMSIIVTTTTVGPVGNPCLPNPCQNSGACYRNGMVFACACRAPWTGVTCETYQAITITSTVTTPSFGITCADMPCRNGGMCYSFENSYYCYCGSNNVYTGKNCETIVPVAPTNCPLNCSPGYCVPSGSSARPYVCMCDGTMKLNSCV
ncbi:hypothetical protein I4U23_010126 [Adineta vaga]|nr:hypothetical protein I4U23_010126 [Adineta vaga]